MRTLISLLAVFSIFMANADTPHQFASPRIIVDSPNGQHFQGNYGDAVSIGSFPGYTKDGLILFNKGSSRVNVGGWGLNGPRVYQQDEARVRDGLFVFVNRIDKATRNTDGTINFEFSNTRSDVPWRDPNDLGPINASLYLNTWEDKDPGDDCLQNGGIPTAPIRSYIGQCKKIEDPVRPNTNHMINDPAYTLNPYPSWASGAPKNSGPAQYYTYRLIHIGANSLTPDSEQTIVSRKLRVTVKVTEDTNPQYPLYVEKAEYTDPSFTPEQYWDGQAKDLKLANVYPSLGTSKGFAEVSTTNDNNIIVFKYGQDPQIAFKIDVNGTLYWSKPVPWHLAYAEAQLYDVPNDPLYRKYNEVYGAVSGPLADAFGTALSVGPLADLVQCSYPWISLAGDFMMCNMGQGRAGDSWIGQDALALFAENLSTVHSTSCSTISSTDCFIPSRSGVSIAGTMTKDKYGNLRLITADTAGNRHLKTQAQFNHAGYAMAGGAWDPAYRIPVEFKDNIRTMSGSNYFTSYTSQNLETAESNWPDYDQSTYTNFEASRFTQGLDPDYLFYSALNPALRRASLDNGAETGYIFDLTTVADISEHSNAVTVNGAYFSQEDPAIANQSQGSYAMDTYDENDGRVGSGITCTDGGVIDVSNSDTLSYTNALTAEAWVKALDPIPTSAKLIFKNPALQIKLVPGSVSGTLQVRAIGSFDATTMGLQGTMSVNSGKVGPLMEKTTWYHIASSIETDPVAASVTLKVYVDGTEVFSNTYSNYDSVGALNKAGTGVVSHFCPNGSGTNAVYVLDEAAISKSARTAEYIAEMAMVDRNTQLQASASFGSFSFPEGIDQLAAFTPVGHQDEWVELGRHIFFDKALSSNGQVSCASCHKPSDGFADTAARSTGVSGVQLNRRTTPFTNLMIGDSDSKFFWDGRALSLEEQTTGPLVNPNEMGGSIDGALTHINSAPIYAPLLAAIAGVGYELDKDGLERALASFMRSIKSGNSAYDQFKAGNAAAMTNTQKAGYEVFLDRCVSCHNGPNLTDGQFHNIGLGDGPLGFDPGRGAVTGMAKDQAAFKTMPLRDLDRREGNGFMHDGRFTTLSEVIDHYSEGGIVNGVRQTNDPNIMPFPLSSTQKTNLIDFLLNALVSQDHSFDVQDPHLPGGDG